MHSRASMMKIKSILFLFFLFFSTAIFADVKSQSSAKGFKEIDATPELLQAIQKGGYVLYMRHSLTDTSRPDQVPLDLNDCNKQRPLSVTGRKLAEALGEQIRKAGIPVGEIMASPMCRAKHTAEEAFGKGNIQLDELLLYTSHLTKAEKAPRVVNTTKLVSKPVEPGSNRILVAHAPNMYDLMGYFPKLEGTVVVFQPMGDTYKYLGSIKPHDWLWLLK